MAKLPVRKVVGPDNEGFSETLKYYVMHQANVETNHNKYFVCEAQKHPDGRVRIFTHYGRLGISNVYEVRDSIDGKNILDEELILKELEKLHDKKLKGKSIVDKKTGKKVRECYVDVDVVSPTVGSENIRGSSSKTVHTSSVKKSAIDTSSFKDQYVTKLLDQLVDENIHNITTTTSLTYTTSGGFQTELGPVTPEHVKKARLPLAELNKLMGKKGIADASNREVRDLNNLFFSLIPKPFSRKITEEDMILKADKLQQEFDMLDQLETAVQMGSAMSGNTSQRMNALGTEIELVKDKKTLERIRKYVESSKAHNHRGSDVWGYKIKRVYQICIPEERKRYEQYGKKLGNVEEVFHGSANANLLSILKGGLIVPPTTAGHVTGRMFGPGLYGANNSTKSLNYSIGYWGARRSKYGNAFLFLADFAMGKTYTAKSAVSGGAPRGYDSVWAKKGYSLYNDELIVYSLPQCTLKYLIEMVR